MAEDLMDYLEGKEPRGFRPRPFYSPDGDFLTFYFTDEEACAERVDELLTVYRSMETRELVGCKIKGVRLLVEGLKNFGVSIEPADGSFKLNLLFLAAGNCRSPERRHYYEQMGRYTKDIDIDNSILQIA